VRVQRSPPLPHPLHLRAGAAPDQSACGAWRFRGWGGEQRPGAQDQAVLVGRVGRGDERLGALERRKVESRLGARVQRRAIRLGRLAGVAHQLLAGSERVQGCVVRSAAAARRRLGARDGCVQHLCGPLEEQLDRLEGEVGVEVDHPDVEQERRVDVAGRAQRVVVVLAARAEWAAVPRLVKVLRHLALQVSRLDECSREPPVELGVRARRPVLERDRHLVLLDRAGQIARVLKRRAEVEVRRAVVRLQLDRLLVRRDGVVKVSGALLQNRHLGVHSKVA